MLRWRMLRRRRSQRPCAFLPSDRVAEIYAGFEFHKRRSVLAKLRHQKPVSDDVRQCIAAWLYVQLQSQRKFGGAQRVAEILSDVQPESESQLLDALARQDPEMVSRITARMFRFDDVQSMNAADLSMLIRNIDLTLWAKALQKQSALRCRIEKVVTKHSAASLKEKIEYFGCIDADQIQPARRHIANVAKYLRQSKRLLCA